MLFNLISVALILMVAGFLSTQGILSALMTLITATFASVLAAALFGPFGSLIGGHWPDMARGVTFLGVFLLVFIVLQFVADFAVPKNISFPPGLNRGIGGFFGLLAGIIVVGSLTLGIQMLPLPTEILGYDRYPTDQRMAGEQSVMWLPADTMTAAIWRLACGHALGGATAFGDVHPNLVRESYGYRNTVQPGVFTALPPDLMKVTAAYVTTDPVQLKKFNINNGGKAGVMIRTEIEQGEEPPHYSGNAGSGTAYFFVTPSEVRMVTDKGHEYNPTGYLEKGRTFTATPLADGQVADDYAGGKVIEDWIFEINEGEKPQFIEVKQLAQAPLQDILKEKPIEALASALYPPKTYRAQNSTVTITFAGLDPEHNAGIKVYVVPINSTLRITQPLFDQSYQNIVQHLQEINGGTGQWVNNAGHPGVPTSGELNTAYRVLQDYKNKGPDDLVPWDQIVPFAVMGQAGLDGGSNLTKLPNFFNNTIVPAMNANGLVTQGTSDAQGICKLEGIPKGSLTFLAAARGANGYYVWAVNKDIKAKSDENITFDAARPEYGCVVIK